MSMGAFEQELMRRSPLAGCVLEISDYIFDDRLLSSIWEGHRGRCYEDVLRFGDFLRLTRDALVRHGAAPTGCSSSWRGTARSRSTRATSTASWPARRWN